MKVYELLTVYKSLFSNMSKQGISQRDIIYLDMFHEYMQMLTNGVKEANIWIVLARKHKLPTSTIKKVIKFLNEEYVM